MKPDLTIEDWFYCDAVGAIMYYYELPEEKRPMYEDYYRAAVRVATRPLTLTPQVIKELYNQESIAFETEEGQRYFPNANLKNSLNSLWDLHGDININIVAAVKDEHILAEISLANLIMTLR